MSCQKDSSLFATNFRAPGWRGSLQTRAWKMGTPWKVLIFPKDWSSVKTAIGTDMLHIITSTGDELYRCIDIDDLKRPWTPKIKVLVTFWRFRAATHILRVNCAAVAGDVYQDNLHIKFSTPNVDFCSPSPDPIGLRRPAYAGVKEGYPLKVVIIPLMARLAWKRLQISIDMLLIISTSDELFSGINIDNLEWP